MFDSVKCEYPLPIPEDLGECSEINWGEFEFKTGSFEGVLDEYEVTEDGEIYHWAIDREWKDEAEHPMGGYLDETHRELKKMDWTGEMMIHGIHLTEDNDYLFEFKLIFYKGGLKEVERITWKVQDASPRKEMQEKFENLFKEHHEKNEKWWYGVYSIWVFIIKFLCSTARWVFRGLSRFFQRIEDWLT